MAFFDILIWGFILLIIGGSVGVGASVLALRYKKKQEDIAIFEVINGKKPNYLELDGERVEIKKFIYKKSDGTIVEGSFKDLFKKVVQMPLKQQKTTLLSKITHMKWIEIIKEKLRGVNKT